MSCANPFGCPGKGALSTGRLGPKGSLGLFKTCFKRITTKATSLNLSNPWRGSKELWLLKPSKNEQHFNTTSKRMPTVTRKGFNLFSPLVSLAVLTSRPAALQLALVLAISEGLRKSMGSRPPLSTWLSLSFWPTKVTLELTPSGRSGACMA